MNVHSRLSTPTVRRSTEDKIIVFMQQVKRTNCDDKKEKYPENVKNGGAKAIPVGIIASTPLSVNTVISSTLEDDDVIILESKLDEIISIDDDNDKLDITDEFPKKFFENQYFKRDDHEPSTSSGVKLSAKVEKKAKYIDDTHERCLTPYMQELYDQEQEKTPPKIKNAKYWENFVFGAAQSAETLRKSPDNHKNDEPSPFKNNLSKDLNNILKSIEDERAALPTFSCIDLSSNGEYIPIGNADNFGFNYDDFDFSFVETLANMDHPN